MTNSLSAFEIILWFSLVIPTEKAVICKSFVCYVHILFWLHMVVLGETRKLQHTEYRQSKLVRLHCSSCEDIVNTSFHTVFYPFHKINSSRHNNIIAFELRYYNAYSWQIWYRIRHWIPMSIATPCMYLFYI